MFEHNLFSYDLDASLSVLKKLCYENKTNLTCIISPLLTNTRKCYIDMSESILASH